MIHRVFIAIVASTLLSLCNIHTAEAQYSREYTKDHPLVIVSDWEFPPYEFRNDKGEPDGYNVVVLSTVLDNLRIPYRFVMQEWYQATETFEKREADLIHALSSIYNKAPYVMTQNMITYYNLRVARLSTTKPLGSISQLGIEDTLRIKKNDYAEMRIYEHGEPAFQTAYHSPREALAGIRNGKYDYYVWGEIPLSLKIKELNLDSIVLDPIDIPTGELRIIGYDQELIEAIDDAFARLEQSGELQQIRDTWFHPERVHNDTSPYTLIILIGVIVAGIITFLLSRLIRSRVKAAIYKSLDLNQMMTQALNMGNFHVIEYDISSDRFRNVHGNLLPEGGLSLDDYISRIHADNRQDFHIEMRSLIAGEKEVWHVRRRWNSGNEAQPEWHFIEGRTIVEKEYEKARYLLLACRDLTQEITEERVNTEMSTKYQRIFETNLMAMSFYDKDGRLIDVNRKMRQLCGFMDADGEVFFRQANMLDVPLLKGQFDPKSRDNFHVCQHMLYPEMKINKYIEFKIRPTFDDNDELKYYIVTARDLTDERTMYLEQRRHAKEILKTNETINRYEEQLMYLLENSMMYVWWSDLRTGKISFSRSLRHSEYDETIPEYTASIYEDEQQGTAAALANPEYMSKPFNVIHHFKHSHYSKTPVWLAISGIPTYEKSGERIGYFGLARDITRLIEAQQKLKEETERAENSGKMKSAFLANMTHEIRTPLNAIVGFSGLLPMAESKEERMEFIRIIRSNCDMLIRLINDILEASNMGQALAIKPKEVDFSKAFDDMCQSLAQRVQEAGVEFIKDNPYDTFPATLDIGRIQQVLTNFTTNAVKYTHEGHIKLGYREQNGGIYFYCEDTGAGIPKEKQASVFERFVKLNDFVQGTGLGLSICKSIAERCGGKIGVTSEGQGHGSTFWLWTPRKITPPKHE